eukprot:1141761-Pelagomonas_calceolata.AAC.4
MLQLSCPRRQVQLCKPILSFPLREQHAEPCQAWALAGKATEQAWQPNPVPGISACRNSH